MSRPTVRPDVAQFLKYLNAVPGPRLHHLAPDAARALFAGMGDVGDLPAGALATIADLSIPGPAGPIPARLFDARDTRAPVPVVLFWHGGGFVVGSIDTHASLCAAMARVLDLPVVSLGYRLAPEQPWPAAPDDAEAAARWIAHGARDLGRTATALVLAGDSAGGTLAIVTAMALRDRPAAVPAIVQALLYPAPDWITRYPSARQFGDGHLLTLDSLRWFADAYAADPADRRASPLFADLAGMPAAVIATAELDPVRDQGRAYAAALIRAGVPVAFDEAMGTIHGFATLRRAIVSAQGDVAAWLAALKPAIVAAATGDAR